MDFNKNELQKDFNQIKGIVTELNDAEKYCSITLEVGHENCRSVNLAVRKVEFDKMLYTIKISDKVCCRFFPVSNRKPDRWHTHLNLLSCERI